MQKPSPFIVLMSISKLCHDSFCVQYNESLFIEVTNSKSLGSPMLGVLKKWMHFVTLHSKIKYLT